MQLKKIQHFLFIFGAVLLMGQGCAFGSPPGTSGPAGMFVSTDKGESWQAIDKLPTKDGVKNLSGVSVYRLFTDPEDTRALYWASREQGFFYSYDEGASWRQPFQEFQTGFVYSIAVHPKNKCIIFATNGNRVLKTEDCTRSWTEVYRESRSDTRITSLVFSPFAPHQIFLSESNGDLLQSLDSGVSWGVVNRFGTDIAEVDFDSFEPETMYVVTRTEGLYRSDDNGKLWRNLKNQFQDYAGSLEFRRFVLHPKKAGVIYWISTYGILLSTDRGDTWTPIDLVTPPGSAQIYAFAINPNNDKELYYTATINFRSTFYKSVDGGKRWITKKLPSGQYPTALYVHPDKGNIIYSGFTIPPQQ